MQLSPVMEKYVLHWGEMGSRWGVNRTVAQIHALLFLANQPLTAEDIADTLNVARSNVSNSLRELQNWGLIRPVHLMGDRRDHFQAIQDVWEIFRIIVEERKRREIDPTVSVLRECVAASADDTQIDAATRQRMQDILDFLDLLTQGYDDLKRLSPAQLRQLLKLGGRLGQLLSMLSDKT